MYYQTTDEQILDEVEDIGYKLRDYTEQLKDTNKTLEYIRDDIYNANNFNTQTIEIELGIIIFLLVIIIGKLFYNKEISQAKGKVKESIENSKNAVSESSQDSKIKKHFDENRIER